MSEEDIILKDIGVSGTKEEILEILKKVYLQTEKELLNV